MAPALTDTICAIATPLGEGGIGIVRVSGEKAVETVAAVVRLRAGLRLGEVPDRTMHLADVREGAQGGGSLVDQALVVVMRGPRSYTGEDVVEVHCHGGAVVLQAVCEALLRCGARVAEPGEFTKRAFLNGRLDLSQAEAVLDTIRAKTAAGLRLAQEQLRGALSAEVEALREPLIRALAHVEAGIDFTEEDIAFITPRELLLGIDRALEGIDRLAESWREGRVLREGVTAVIAGRPNVGKSSLLNALIRSDRAIVTPIPGTTRDVLEEQLSLRGVPVRLLDTAGVRDSADPVEQEGVRRSRSAIERADLVLLVLDGSVPLTEEDRTLLGETAGGGERKRLLVINKADLPPAAAGPGDMTQSSPPGPDVPVWISARTGQGLEALRDRVRALVLRADFEPGDAAVVTRVRHRDALLRAGEALAGAKASVESSAPAECVALDLRGAIHALGEITGEVTTDDILGRIFSEFCIGK